MGLTRRGRSGAHQTGWVSLAEILIALALVLVTVTLGFAVGHSGRGQVSVKGIASQLLADLRWARQWAASHGQPAGVLIPSEQPACQVYAVITADNDVPERMCVRRIEDWTRMAGEAFLCVGTWSGAPFSAAANAFGDVSTPTWRSSPRTGRHAGRGATCCSDRVARST